eukprot:EG_transcript_3325
MIPSWGPTVNATAIGASSKQAVVLAGSMTHTPTLTATATLTPSRTPTRSATASPSSTTTSSATGTRSRTPTLTSTSSYTPSASATATPTRIHPSSSPTPTGTQTQTSTLTATSTTTRTRTANTTASPSTTTTSSLTRRRTVSPTPTGTSTRTCSMTPTTSRLAEFSPSVSPPMSPSASPPPSSSPSPVPSPSSRIVLNATTNVTRPTTYAGPVTVAAGASVSFQQPVTFTRPLTVEAGSTLNINAEVTVAAPAVITNTSIEIAADQTLVVVGTTAVLREAVATGLGLLILSYNGTSYVQVPDTRIGKGTGSPTNTALQILNSKLMANLQQNGQPRKNRRRTDLGLYVTTYFCGSTCSGLTLDGYSATEFQLWCQLGDSEYSNVIESLAYSPGAGIALANVSAAARPTLVTAFHNPGSASLEADSPGGGPFTRTVLLFGVPAGGCPTAFPQSTVFGCPAG